MTAIRSYISDFA